MKSKIPVLLNKASYIAIMALVLLLVNVLVFGSDAEVPKESLNFELTDVNGTVWKSDDLKGSVVVFNFWFTSCPPCKKEIPELNKLVEDYKNKGVVFIGVSLNNQDEVEGFTYMHPFKYNLIPDGDGFIDENHISSFPTHFIVDRNGYLVDRIVGGVTYDKLKKQIDKLL